jgi:hypothetical protein
MIARVARPFGLAESANSLWAVEGIDGDSDESRDRRFQANSVSENIFHDFRLVQADEP